MTGNLPLATSDEDLVTERRFGMKRRSFIQLCAGLAATLGLANNAVGAIFNALVDAKRPSVIWLHFQECTGCTESLLRA